MNKDLKVLDCPFCGGNSKLVKVIGENNLPYFDVSCCDIKCRGFAVACRYISEEGAINYWNRRANDASKDS
jgi:C4-type Zn-finger protein